MDEITKVISLNAPPSLDELAFLAKRIARLMNTSRILKLEPSYFSRKPEVELDEWMFREMAKDLKVKLAGEAPLPGFLKDSFIYNGVEFYCQRKDYSKEDMYEPQEIQMEPQ